MMISKTSKILMEEDERKIDLSMLKKFICIFFISMIIFTIIYFTCFGCFLVLNETPAQTVTLSSEGPANETYPESMGEYQLAEEEIQGHGVGNSLTIYNWYCHKDRQDRFLMYNELGNIVCHFMKFFNISLPLDYHWYITHTNVSEKIWGVIRSEVSGHIIYPGLQWEYLPFNISNCTTVR